LTFLTGHAPLVLKWKPCKLDMVWCYILFYGTVHRFWP